MNGQEPAFKGRTGGAGGILRPVFVVALLLLALAVGLAPARAITNPPVPADRWLEIDLYWFDPDRIDASAKIFWDRYTPLYRDVAGYKGVVLNVGMTVNYIMEFSGDLDQRIALPRGAGQEIGVGVSGTLTGNTAQRQRAWRQRFGAHDNRSSQIGYGEWRYRQLRLLADALRAEGARRGIADFRVGTLAVAHRSAYGEVAPFARSHPEAWTRWGAARDLLDTSAYFDPNAVLNADTRRYAAMPGGIVQGTPVHAMFGAQWGALSRALKLDAIMLRDSFGLPRAYTRYGPNGPALPDGATVRRMTDGVSAMLHALKQGNRAALTMMWSSAATATADWRANGLDLERIAHEGNLDIFVDQTWAGAWNEVGVRQQTYWNAPLLGWTYQLNYLLQHRAVLAGSRVRHYFLTETFDAWESWDTIHTVPGRLRWAIWAYSHAGAKTPRGIEMPAGSYIAWGNRGTELLSDGDVAFLRDNLDASARDAAEVADILGPTLVYTRETMRHQAETIAPGFDARDRIDEHVGSIVKWPLPVLSITRTEWLPRIGSDLLLFGATAPLPSARRDMVEALARQGQPMAFFGGVNAGIDPALARLADVSARPHMPPLQDRSLRAELGEAAPDNIANIPASFDAPPTALDNLAKPGTVVYGFGDSAGLVLNQQAPFNIALWDPPSLADYWYRPLRDLMNGSAAPYALATATLNKMLAARGALRAGLIDLDQTGTVAGWTRRDGTLVLLAGNLEEGLRDDADHGRRISLRLPAPYSDARCNLRARWGSAQSDGGGAISIELAGQASVLLELVGASCSSR